MSKIITVIMLMVLCVGTPQVQAAIDWDFYDDGIIQEGDEYNNVGVYDTPPDHTTVDMLGGIVDSMGAYNESTINMTGGFVHTLWSLDSSNVNMSGGWVHELSAYDTGMVNISGDADVVVLAAREFGVVNMSGGVVDYVGPTEYGTVNLSGGLVNEFLATYDSGIINIYGYDLAKSASGGGWGYGLVTGEWADETIFSIDFGRSETYSHVMLHEIPEPSTVVIIITGLLFFRKRQS